MKINGKTISSATSNDTDAIRNIVESFNIGEIPMLDTAIAAFNKSTYRKYLKANDTVRVLLAVIAYAGQDRCGVDLDGMLASYIDVLYALYVWRGETHEALVELTHLLLYTDFLALDSRGELYLHDISNLRKSFNSTAAVIELSVEDGNLGELKSFIQITSTLYKELGKYLESETEARMNTLIKSL